MQKIVLKGYRLRLASSIWHGLESCRSIINKGKCYLVGRRYNVYAWQDPQIPWLLGFQSHCILHWQWLILLTWRGGVWADQRLEHFFEEQTIDGIKKIPIPRYSMYDGSVDGRNSGFFFLGAVCLTGQIKSINSVIAIGDQGTS